MGKVIGIDLGTTNSVAAFFEGGQAHIVLTPEGERLLPSQVAFSQAGDRLVGNPAKSQAVTNPNTIYSVKRLVGKRFSEVKPYLSQFNYQIVEGEDDTLKIRINDVLFSPEEISAMIIEKLKDAAEQHLGDVIEGAIITVPAYFNDSQRQATKDAGEIAGLNVMRIINEPTAASLAFSIDLSRKANVLVYDFGGGTIDISVLEIQDEVIKVLATAGDINLGGNDFDILLTDQILDEISQESQLDLSGDKLALQRIRDAAENAKKELSGLEECEINLPFIGDSDSGPIHYSRLITRPQLEEIISDKVKQTLTICERALESAGLGVEEIDEVMLVGGSTRIPLVQKKVREYFKKDPNKKVNPDEIVAMGAAMQGAIARGESKDILLLDVIPLSLGVKTHGGAFTRLIEANTTIPTNRSLVFSTVEDNQQEVEISVYQGEREIAEQNKLLGTFALTGIKEAPKGIPRIEVSFSININGILKVSAIDLSTKRKKEVMVTNSGLLNDKDIAKIKKNAEQYKKADLEKKKLIDVKNKIFNHIYSIQNVLEDPNLDPQSVSLAKDLIKMARSETSKVKENPDALKTVKEKLAALEKQLGAHAPKKDNAKRTTEPSARPQPAKEHGPLRVPITRTRIERADLPPKKEIKTKKEILNFVYSIEQYINGVELGGDILIEARSLIEQAHNVIDSDQAEGLAAIHRKLSAMTTRLDDLVGRALGIIGDVKPPTQPSEALDLDMSVREPLKDDTRPFKIYRS